MKKLPTKSSVIAILLSLAFLPQFVSFAGKSDAPCSIQEIVGVPVG